MELCRAFAIMYWFAIIVSTTLALKTKSLPLFKTQTRASASLFAHSSQPQLGDVVRITVTEGKDEKWCICMPTDEYDKTSEPILHILRRNEDISKDLELSLDEDVEDFYCLKDRDLAYEIVELIEEDEISLSNRVVEDRLAT